MTRVGVTGAAGFIGGALVRYLSDLGHEVVGLDNFTGPLTVLHSDIPVVRADIREERAQALLHGTEVILHLAARSGVMACAEDPAGSAAVNVAGTEHLVAFCAREGIPLAFASSFAVGGVPEALPITETTPARPPHEYARQKAAGEEAVRTLSTRHGVAAAVLRMSNVLGRYTVDGRPIAKGNVLNLFADQARTGTLLVSAPGTQRRDFIHLMDVLAHWEAVARRLAAAPRAALAPTFNVASGESSTIRELAERVAARWPVVHPGTRAPEVKIVPNPRGAIEILQPEFDVDRRWTERELGVTCRYRLERSIDAALRGVDQYERPEGSGRSSAHRP